MDLSITDEGHFLLPAEQLILHFQLRSLVKKYNVPGPRYTSYPTVPYWKNDPLSTTEWKNILQNITDPNMALYIHLPYCESLCTFCGCHKRITKNHAVEKPYIDALIKEWQLYRDILPKNLIISEIHLGGGTPTFFASSEIKRLILRITEGADLSNCSMGFEAHPNNTKQEHLETLSSLGFKRISFGIQDYDPVVQKAIHRIQPFENVQHIHESARNMGFSINHDLVYGLPFQSMEGFVKTLEKTVLLRPERIALYSYAHVPWVKGTGQRGFRETDLPNETLRMALYEFAQTYLIEAGYTSIGMDHFALPDDDLTLAIKNGTLHRNFMGYTPKTSRTMIGLGMSAISDAWTAFAQNKKEVESYIHDIEEGHLPIFRGHILTKQDLKIREKILELMCHFQTQLPKENREAILQRMEPLIEDQMVLIQGDELTIPSEFRGFIRNVCMCFDEHLANEPKVNNTFSKTI